MDELRRKGLEKMNEVYGWEMPDMPGDYFALTADHLFGTIWTRPGLSMRDKRMMTLTCVTALGISELAEIQVNAALSNEEFTVEELKEMAIFLTHYLGFPLGSKLDGVVTKVAGKRKKDAEKGSGGDTAEDRRANVNAALNMHSGSKLDDE
jgi:4-carboxymuconolactone decarboxylase